MDTSPNSPLDILSQDVAQLKQDVAKTLRRFNELDQTILKILQTFKRGEEAFELRVSRVLRNVLGGVVHELDHSISATAEAISQLERGFDIFVVDGKEIKENDKTVLVVKHAGGYDYSLATDPETIINASTEPFSAFFDKNPDIFGDKTELLVNIISYTTRKQEATNGEG